MRRLWRYAIGIEMGRVIVAMWLALATTAPVPTEAAPGQFNSRWIPVRVSASAVVNVPTDNWTDIASMAVSDSRTHIEV